MKSLTLKLISDQTKVSWSRRLKSGLDTASGGTSASADAKLSPRLRNALSTTKSVLVLGLLLAALTLGPYKTVAAAPLRAGAAPAFSLPDEHGALYSLQQYRGKVVVLNFWAFWCNTWNAEMPHLRQLVGREGTDGFKLVCISVDGTRLTEWQKQRGAPVMWPVLLDGGGKVRKAYNVAHVPTVVVIDGNGQVRASWEAYPGNEAVLRAVSQVRKGQVVTPYRPARRAKVKAK